MASLDKQGLTTLWNETKSYINGRLQGVATTFDYDEVASEDATIPAMPIEQGGTGGKSAEEALANLGGTSTTLLWENASPTAEFPTQTISLDLSDYDMVMVLSNFSSSISFKIPTFVEVKEGVTSSSLCEGTYGMNAGMYVYYRVVYTTIDSVKFSNGWNANASSETKDETVIIPYRIYGIKGVN